MSILLQQADYVRSPAGFETAQAIVAAKLCNCEYLLTRYVARRHRSGAGEAAALRNAQNVLSRLRTEASCSRTQRELLLVEARGGKVYWRAVSLLCREGRWRRQHHAPSDALNRYLNIGYHLLALQCEKALLAAGLYLEAGVLHGERSGKPLLYDFMEVFRQPAVDCVVIPLFSRKRRNYVSERDTARLLGRLKQRFNSRFPFHGRCESLRRIMSFEATALKKAMYEKKTYHPYHHRWGNSSSC